VGRGRTGCALRDRSAKRRGKKRESREVARWQPLVGRLRQLRHGKIDANGRAKSVTAPTKANPT
ncbi:hypothetical protein, partial [Hafnia paralvei]|uniref:hypothetical protein n=1 Tax=Hafnia paralvei TaxID=546367 RepID=UPI001C6A00F3